MRTVNFCSNKILQFFTRGAGLPANAGCPVSGCKMAVIVVVVVAVLAVSFSTLAPVVGLVGSEEGHLGCESILCHLSSEFSSRTSGQRKTRRNGLIQIYLENGHLSGGNICGSGVRAFV